MNESSPLAEDFKEAFLKFANSESAPAESTEVLLAVTKELSDQLPRD
jgi:hypothetical protein